MTKKQVFVILFGVCWLASIQCRRIGRITISFSFYLVNAILVLLFFT